MTTHRSCFTTPAESSRWRSPRAGNPVLGPCRTGCDARPARGLLGKDVLGRIRDYIMAHLEEPIEVATLAAIAGRSSFHFTHIRPHCGRESAPLHRASPTAMCN